MIATVTEKALLRDRLARAHLLGVAGATFLLDHVVDDVTERLAGIERSFPLAVVHGSRSDALCERLAATGKARSIFRMELSAPALGASRFGGIVADEEALPLGPASIDLVVSALALQWTNDLPGALIQIARALRPGGLFLAALTGGSTLSELREALFVAETEVKGGASPRVLPTADVRDLGALLQRAGFALPVADRDVLTARYASAFALFADLKAMGAANVLMERARKPTARRVFARAAEIYAERFSDADGRVRATFEIISLSGWAPQESRQRPTRRGPGEMGPDSHLG